MATSKAEPVLQRPYKDLPRAEFPSADDLTWPQRVHAHARDWHARSFGETTWRDPQGHRPYDEEHPDWPSPHAYPYRTCSYCGSIHPAELYAHLRNAPEPPADLPPDPMKAMEAFEDAHGLDFDMQDWNAAYARAQTAYYLARTKLARLEGADWKYGWPHKFYVEGIPNPVAGQQVVNGSTHDSIRHPDGSYTRIVTPHWGTASPTVPAKWYNAHFRDFAAGQDSDEDAGLRRTVAYFSEIVDRSSGIHFQLTADGDVAYWAPHHNYQHY